MIQHEIKLYFTNTQKRVIQRWFTQAHHIYNWGHRKLLDSYQDPLLYIHHYKSRPIHRDEKKFQNILAGHSKPLEMPSQVIQGTLLTVFDAWKRFQKKLSKQPRFKNKRKNPLSSLSFPAPFAQPKNNRIFIPCLGDVKFRSAPLPIGKIKRARLLKKAHEYYLALFIDAEPKKIEPISHETVGIDPGYKTNLTLSNGIKIEKNKRFAEVEKRIDQANKGGNKKLLSRLYNHLRNQRKNDNHHLSKDLVSKYKTIAFSKDNIKGLQSTNGKSVGEATHYQLRMMLDYKAKASNRHFIEVLSSGSTITCSICLKKTGPTGFEGLKIRNWKCTSCNTEHDRDVNSAIVTLLHSTGQIV